MSSTGSKADLRTAALVRREALSVEQRNAAAQAISARGLPVEIARGTIVTGYSPIRSELDPAALMQTLATRGAQLALPVITAREQPLLFRRWRPGDQLVRGTLGIMEPSPQSPAVIPDVLLVPLAAFDREGHRIGYGAGHYDRTLAELRATTKILAIGVAFAAQEIPAVPSDVHDVRLDLVLTENEIIDLRSS